MKIITTVIVKQVLTKKSKDRLLEKFENQKRQLLKECDQLRFEMKKYDKNRSFSNSQMKNRFTKEIETRMEKSRTVDFQMEQLHILPLGSELKETDFQGLVDVEVGDQWDESLKEKVIVIKDGIVVEIR